MKGPDLGGDGTVPTLTVVVPVLDELTHLPGLIASIEAQTFVPDQVIVVDGMSTDGTREWVQEAKATRPWLVMLDNPDRIVPVAMNRGILAAEGDLIARMDGHAAYAQDYLEQLVRALVVHPDADVVGGVYRMAGSGAWGGAIASVLRDRLALGGAPHRNGSTGQWVDHVGTGCYRRATLVRVHGFDPSLPVNEDFELDHRIRRTGGRIRLEPRAHFTSFSRATPRALARQMWRYGYYKARTLHMHPTSLKLRQTAPALLVAGLLFLTATRPRSGATSLMAYLAVSAATGAAIARRSGESAACGAVTLPLIHLSWGSGLWVGLVAHALPRGPQFGGPTDRP